MTSRLARMAAAAVVASALTAASANAATPSAFVYATSWSQTARQYSADDTGLLSPLTPPDVATGLTSTAVAASPDRRSLYVVNQTSSTVSQFNIAADGTLTAKTPESVATGRSPVALAIAPDGRHAYVVNQGDETVSTYSVDASGALTFAATAATGAGPLEIAASPDGASVYVTNFSAGSVSQYDVTTTGALAPKAAGTVAAGSQPAGVAVSRDGASVYVTNQLASGTVRRFSVDAETGALTSQATVGAGTQPRGIAVAADRVYVSNVGSSTISQYAADGTGALTQLAPPVSAPGSPFGLSLSPDGRNLYVALFGNGAVGQYDVAGDGRLSATADPEPAGFRPQSVVAVKPRDEQAPTIDLATPSEGAQYEQDAAVAVEFTCADEGGSGLQSCTGDVPDGDPLDTSTPGSHHFTVVARDGEGNETTVTHSYTVTEPPPPPPPTDPGLDFQGFLGPIHQGSVVRAGDAIPIVFSLGGDRGLDVLATGSPSSVQTDCDHPGAPTGGDPASSKAGHGLIFNSWTGHYVFVWQTRKSWAGTCRTFVLGLRDGGVARLTVRFRSAWGWHR
jgi:6-phosphogluconolactonase (cycloisomerase 2 family)